MKFGEAIKARREQLGLTQQELAEKLFVSRQTVCRWENGTRCPDLVMAKKIAFLLGISIDELIPGDVAQDYTPAREPELDLSCVKVMLTGVMLLLIGIFLLVADDWNMEIAALCLIGGMIVFIVGLCIPWHKGEPIIDDALPQRQCPQCGKSHDFDYPKCPYCDHDYYKK